LEALNAALDRWAGAKPAAVLESFRARDALRGRQISWEGGSGTADGVDERGNLVVRVPGGEVLALGAGEIHLG
jgi:BirA family biotin operon repressor/biotin-[acetyl-CoA-carboxylase] ligase